MLSCFTASFIEKGNLTETEHSTLLTLINVCIGISTSLFQEMIINLSLLGLLQ